MDEMAQGEFVREVKTTLSASEIQFGIRGAQRLDKEWTEWKEEW